MAKIRLCISAKHLPKSVDSYASVAISGEDIGRSETLSETANPQWKKIFIIETDDPARQNISIKVESTTEGHLGSVELGLERIVGENQGNVAAVAMEGGGIVFVYADDHPVEGALLLQICAEDLTNTEGFLSRSLSDPFYEVQGVASDVVYKSEVIRENLNPVWEKAELPLEALCGGDMDMSIKFTVFDQDPDDKRDLMGVFEASVNTLLSAKGESFNLTKRGRKSGRILVLVASLHNFTDCRETAWELAEAKATTMDAEAELETKEIDAVKKSKGAALLMEIAEKARRIAEEKEMEAETALEQSEMAEKAAADTKYASKQAAEKAAELQKAPPSGVLSFKFVGEKLKNVEGLGILRKSDPFFVLQRSSEDKEKDSSWTSVHTSNVVKNNLDPSWSEGEVQVNSLVSRNLDEPLRFVVFDREKNGKHELMGSLETSISELLSKAGEPLSISKNEKETGYIHAPKVELQGYVDPKETEEEARVLAAEAENAHFFAIGRKAAAKVASDAANEARNNADEAAEEAKKAAKEAETAAEEVKLAKKAAEDAACLLASVKDLKRCLE